MKKEKDILLEFFPQTSVDFAFSLIKKHKVFFKITPERLSKKGDYYPPQRGNGHIITINGSLPEYEFLLTFLHEFAHLFVWEKYKNTVQSHGKEWKSEFQSILLDAVSLKLFPEKLEKAIFYQYLRKQAFSAQANTNLLNVLRELNPNDKTILVGDLPKGAKFWLKNGMCFVKGEKLRKRYKCKECNTKRTYTVHGFAEIIKYEL
jgi:predicted SprT family Zn-dependent metalloprotease